MAARAGTTPRRKLGYAIVALGTAVLLVGGVLQVGSVAGLLSTFPHAGAVTVCVGVFLAAIGASFAVGASVLDGVGNRRTSLVVVLLALLLFGPMLLAAALLFARVLEHGASAGMWLGSTVFLLLAIAMVSALLREIILRFDLHASAPRHGDAGGPPTPPWPGWRAHRIERVTRRIQAAMESLLASRVRERVWMWHFGANDINPRNLVFVICVQSDTEKTRLEADADLRLRLRSLLDEFDYPEKGRAGVAFCVESQQTVDRESGGNWWHHFK